MSCNSVTPGEGSMGAKPGAGSQPDAGSQLGSAAKPSSGEPLSSGAPPSASLHSAPEQTLSFAARRAAAADFARRWHARGYEKGETAAFWRDLLGSVVGFAPNALSELVEFERRTSSGGFIDVFIPESKALIEQKALGVNLDDPELRQGTLVTPFEQAKRYADSLPNQLRRFS